MNAARQLAAIFRMWQVKKGETVLQNRGADGQGALDPMLWSHYAEASAFMHEIENSIRDMEESGENVDHYKEFIPNWWSALVIPDRHWGETATNSSLVISRSDLALLDALAGHLERGVPKAKEPDQETIDLLIGMLEEVAALAEADTDLAFAMKTRIAGLIRSVRDILGQYMRYSPEQLQHVLDELTGVTARAAIMSHTPAVSASWLGVCTKLSLSMVSGFFQGSGDRAIESIAKGVVLEIANNSQPLEAEIIEV